MEVSPIRSRAQQTAIVLAIVALGGFRIAGHINWNDLDAGRAAARPTAPASER